MKEIGGYMDLERAHGTEFHENAIALNSGRHCLEYLIRAKNIRKLYIPYFLCASVKNLCVRLHCKYEYYRIDGELHPIFDEILNSNEYLYIVNYYGQTDNGTIRKYKEKYNNVIIDNVQAFFQKPVENIDTLYSCRKFFGVSDGGYLYTDAILKEIDKDVSYDRMMHVLGRFEKDASFFYEDYQNGERAFNERKMRSMSNLTHNLLRSIDYDYSGNKRTENFSYLHQQLRDKNKLTLIVPNGAFMYPFYTEKGAELKKRLIENKIYVPTLWPDVFDISDKQSIEWELAENIVPLPIDQRYDAEDMEYIIEKIKECS